VRELLEHLVDAGDGSLELVLVSVSLVQDPIHVDRQLR
jgi:hypothetical protein